MPVLRICQLITDLGPAGAERCVYELARRLDRRRFEVSVAALRGGLVADWLAAAGVDAAVVGVRGKWDVLKLARLAELLRRRRIDILHTHLFHADLAGRAAAAIAGTRHVVHTVHIVEARFRPWRLAFARLAAGMCDRIVAVSNSVRDHHSSGSGLPRGRYVVIPNGVDAEAHRRDAAARRRLRSQWGLRRGEVLLAFVGRLDVQKGVDTLLEAMKVLHGRAAAPRLAIAGDGPMRRDVEGFVATEPVGKVIELLGFTEDVRGLLSAADVLVMPSRWEGFGLAAAEAMAASLPVLATRVEGLCDVVVEGKTALLVERDDPEALAKQIEFLAGDAALRRRLGQAGRRRAVRCLSIAATVAAHEKLYLDLASGDG